MQANNRVVTQQTVTYQTTILNFPQEMVPKNYTDIQGAKNIARQLLEKYGKTQAGVITLNDIPQILNDLKFEGFNNQNDLEILFQVMDSNRDGMIDQQDIENMCIRYLCPLKRYIYSPDVEQRLNVARRLFKKFDVDQSNFIEEKEVNNLLVETYQQIGIKFQPTQQDIQSWLQMSDTLHKDGKVSLEEYELIVIKSLEKSGMKIERQQIVL